MCLVLYFKPDLALSLILILITVIVVLVVDVVHFFTFSARVSERSHS